MIKFLNFLSNKLNFFKLLLSDKRIIKFVLNPFKLAIFSIIFVDNERRLFGTTKINNL